MKAFEAIDKALDITGAHQVEVLVREDGKVVWINVDGICLLRVCRIKKVQVNDKRVLPTVPPGSAHE